MANFFRRGKSLLDFLPAVAGTSPTAPEIAAGTPLSVGVNALAGFQFSNTRIDIVNLASSYTSQIPGPDTTQASTLTFNDDDASTTTRTALAKGTSGFILRRPYGATSGKRAEVWPITSAGVNDEWSLGNDPAKYAVDVAVTAPPTLNAVLP